MCHERSHKDSFLATFTAVREETPEPQAFVTGPGYNTLLTGEGRAAYTGNPIWKLFIPHSKDLPFLKGCAGGI